MTRVVLDASAGVEWVLQSEIGTRVERAVAAAELWVPEHFYVETAATIRRLQLASQVTEERASIALSRLLATPAHRAQIRPLLVTLDANLANAPTLGIDTLVP